MQLTGRRPPLISVLCERGSGIRSMRRRLRKKRRLREFRENAFDVSYKLRAGLSPDEAAGFLFRFLEQACGSARSPPLQIWVRSSMPGTALMPFRTQTKQASHNNELE
jgi:hypothetical protein